MQKCAQFLSSLLQSVNRFSVSEMRSHVWRMKQNHRCLVQLELSFTVAYLLALLINLKNMDKHVSHKMNEISM